MRALQVKSPNVVCVLISTGRGVFIGVQGGVTNLVNSVTSQVVAGWPSHVAGWPCGSASTDFLHRLGLPLLIETRVHKAAGQTDTNPGQLVTPWAHWSVTFAHCLLVSGASLG
jgi:hypothetical protein